MWRNKTYRNGLSSLRKTRRLWVVGGDTGPYITITAGSIAENATNGTAIGTLAVANPPVGHGVYVFTINSDPDGLFDISGGALDKNGTLDYEAATSHQVQIKADDSTTPVILQWFTITVTNVAPVLSNATDTKTGQTTADITVDTTEDTGTLYWVVTTSGTTPTAAQIIAGQDNSGVAAAAAGTQAISTTGTKTVNVTGLTAATGYTAHFVHKEGTPGFLNSNTISGDGFTTDGAASWQTAWSKALNTDSTGHDLQTLRSIILAANISLSGTTVRITFTAHSANKTAINNAAIVERSGTSANGTGVPTEILFNSGQHGFSINGGTTIVSDSLSFSLDHTKDYLLIVDYGGAGNDPQGYYAGGGTTASRHVNDADDGYYKLAAASYNQQNLASDGALGGTYLVSKIEVFA